MSETLRALAEAEQSVPSSASADDGTAGKIAECDRKLAQYRAALDAGANPATVAGWIAETEAEIAARLAVTTGSPASLIARTLLDDAPAVLGATDRLVHLRGTGVQWNPADHLRVAGQVVCQPAPGTPWMAAYRDAKSHP
jgi:hypothetical protein